MDLDLTTQACICMPMQAGRDDSTCLLQLIEEGWMQHSSLVGDLKGDSQLTLMQTIRIASVDNQSA